MAAATLSVGVITVARVFVRIPVAFVIVDVKEVLTGHEESRFPNASNLSSQAFTLPRVTLY